MTYNTKTGKGKNTKDMDYNNSSRRFRPWGSRVVALSIKCASLALRTESREEWIFSSGINLWFFLHVSMRMVRVREKVFSFLEIQRLQLPGSSSTVFAVNLILTYVTQIQFSQCLFQCSVTGAGSTGGARGPRPPIFRPEWGLKGRKNIFWRPPSTPPPPNLSKGLDDRSGSSTGNWPIWPDSCIPTLHSAHKLTRNDSTDS